MPVGSYTNHVYIVALVCWKVRECCFEVATCLSIYT